MIHRGRRIVVTRRGYPDTPELFAHRGFVMLAHTIDARSWMTAYPKDYFDAHELECYAMHANETGLA